MGTWTEMQKVIMRFSQLKCIRWVSFFFSSHQLILNLFLDVFEQFFDEDNNNSIDPREFVTGFWKWTLTQELPITNVHTTIGQVT
jgi:hypothetical protein